MIFDKRPNQDDVMKEEEEPINATLERPQNSVTLVNNGMQQQPSFRDMVQGNTSSQTMTQLMEQEEEEDDVSDDDTAPENILTDEHCPAILLSKEEKIQIRKPWKNTLVMKMFDGNVGYMGLMRKLGKKYNLRGEMSLTDIGHKLFIARFTNVADYNFVLIQGPWMIDDNYLTIRKWIPNFVPDESPIKILTA